MDVNQKLSMIFHGQRLTWVIQQMHLVPVLSLQAHWQEGHSATVVEHSLKEQDGKRTLILVTVVL